MQYKESYEQREVIKWARHPLVLKQYPQLKLLYANHNTQLLTPAQSARWSALGGKAGVPDMFLAVPHINEHDIKCNRTYYDYLGLYIEMKSPDLKPKTSRGNGGLSTAQLNFFPYLKEQKYKVEVCYSAIEAIHVIEQYIQ